MDFTTFPINQLLPAIATQLQVHSRLVLEASPGAGKTTQVPLALLNASWRGNGRIVVLEPRRVAARAAANFMAKQLGQVAGQTVGYRIRFENRISSQTQIEVVTEGILTRMIQDDPALDGIAAIIFDEFHERQLAGDLGLALALDVQSQLREDLRLLVMSATLDGERLAAWLDAPRLTAQSRSFAVTTTHFPSRRDESLQAQLVRAIELALTEHPGDLLVFLPGQREISRMQTQLSSLAEATVLALHGELPIEQQNAVLNPDPSGKRRVILSTNVAESSVTLPGVRVVIDSGLAREPRFDPNSGFSRLDVVNISQASADQRAGRAGRVAEGWCYRLWPASQRLEPMRSAEIAQVDLAALALELAAWGSADLRFFDTPPRGALASARDLLVQLGALDAAQRITALGRAMLQLGTHPRLAAMLLGVDGQDQALACDLAALLEARDPLRSRRDDLAARWQALAAFRQGRIPADASRSALQAIDQAAKNWRRRLRCELIAVDNLPAHRLGDLLIHAFPDRIGRQHPIDPYRYQLANGRSARLFDDSTMYGQPWIVVSELRFEARDASVLRALPVDEISLHRQFPEQFVERDIVHWDIQTRALQVRRETRFFAIVLASKSAGRPDPALAARALTDAVVELGLSALPWTPALEQLRERVRCLRQWMPELGLPDWSDQALLATLDDWLLPAFADKTRLDALTESELQQALLNDIDWALRQRIDELAPQKILVPSCMERTLEYQHGHAPILAVKLQELFGLADTPRIADGRIALTLHLLSPGGKPLQITQDLKSFWNNTYPDVKKEMKGRYPKHPWPDDPWTAIATHRAKPRVTK